MSAIQDILRRRWRVLAWLHMTVTVDWFGSLAACFRPAETVAEGHASAYSAMWQRHLPASEPARLRGVGDDGQGSPDSCLLLTSCLAAAAGCVGAWPDKERHDRQQAR